MKYPLLPYSQLVFDMLKTNPDVYYTRFSLHVDKKKVDVDGLKNAFEASFRNHPAFSMYVDERGMQQYNPSADVLHGQYHSVDFCDEKETVRIDISYNRILGDAIGQLIVFEDVCCAYQNLHLLPDNYMEYLARMEQLKQSARYLADKQWLEAEYDSLTCPVHPQTDVPINDNRNPIEGVLLENYSSCRDAINTLAHQELLPLTALFSLACAFAIMEYNGTDDAALTWAYAGRETPEEQRVFGSLHRDIPFHIHKSQINNRETVIRSARKQYREGIAHSTYPFTLTKPHTEIWNYALNVLAQPSPEQIFKASPFTFEMVLPTEEPNVAYALLDVEILEGEQLYINYRYSATHYKPESIRRFAALVRKYVEWLID